MICMGIALPGFSIERPRQTRALTNGDLKDMATALAGENCLSGVSRRARTTGPSLFPIARESGSWPHDYRSDE